MKGPKLEKENEEGILSEQHENACAMAHHLSLRPLLTNLLTKSDNFIPNIFTFTYPQYELR